MVLNELWDPGWQVTVDGRAATAVRANHLLRGVVVDAGAHAIAWRYEPRGMRALTIAMLLGWLATLGALLVPTKRAIA